MDLRVQSFAEALGSFAYLANVDIPALSATLDPRLIDGLQNGKAQKFESPGYHSTLDCCSESSIRCRKQQHDHDEHERRETKNTPDFLLISHVLQQAHSRPPKIPLRRAKST